MPRFRLLVGTHVERLPGGGSITYQANDGQVIDSPSDLEGYYGRDKFQRVLDNPQYIPASQPEHIQLTPTELEGVLAARKQREAVVAPSSVEATTGGTTTKPPSSLPQGKPLDKMTEKELRTYAEEEEIDVRTARNRDELLKILKPTR